MPDCIHKWRDRQVVFPCGTSQSAKVCVKCAGLIQQCEGCKQFHLVEKGQGGADSMPKSVNRAWLEQHACTAESIEDIPIPFVRMPPYYDTELDTCASYWEDEDQLGVYELAEFSG